MVRIVNNKQGEKKQVQQAPQLTEKSKALLQIIGIAIADNPNAIKELLEDYSVEISENISEKELADKLLSAVCENDKEFNSDLARIILDCGLNSDYDDFDFKSLLGSGKESDDGSGGNGGSGGLLSGITNAIGGIGNAIGAKRQAKEEATSKTLQGIYSYRTQLAASEQSKSKTKMYTMLGLFLVLGLALLALMNYRNKQQTQQTSLINA